MNYEMIEHNVVVCCYGKILVNVAAYVISGYVYVVYLLFLLFLVFRLILQCTPICLISFIENCVFNLCE